MIVFFTFEHITLTFANNMKKAILTLFVVVGFFVGLLAQEIQSFSFKDGIGGVKFTKTELMTAVPKGDGLRVYLELSRIGAVQVGGTLKSGGNDPVDVYALGILDFTADMKLENETLQWLKPEGVLAKKYSILEKPGAILSDPLATQDDCLGIFEVIEKYPDLDEGFDLFASKTTQEAKVYYQNRVTTTMLGKIKGFKGEKITVNTEGEESSEETEIEFDPYRNSTKNDYWIMQVGSECDPNTGDTWVTNGRIIAKEYSNRAYLYLRELVVFDEKGKEKNRTEITFEKPHDLQYGNFFIDEEGSITGKTEVYTQLHGFGYKKLNPSPEPEQRVIYEWDKNGVLKNQVTLSAPQEDFKIFYCNRGQQKSTYLAYSSLAKAFYTTPLENGTLGTVAKVDKASAMGAGLYGQETSLPQADLSLISREKMGANAFLAYDVTKTTTASGQSPVTTWLGNFFVELDGSGSIVATNAVMGGNKHKVRFYESASGQVMLLVGGGKLELYDLAPNGKMEQMYKMNESAENASSLYIKENGQLVVTTILPDQALEVQLVQLK